MTKPIPAAATDPALDQVEVEALGLISFDGDPETEGSEYYAPADYLPEDDQTQDAEGKSLLGLPSRFFTTRIQADALVKAKAVRIV